MSKFGAIFITFFSLLLLCGCSEQETESSTFSTDSFYVWQRSWEPAVADACRKEKGELFLLAGELSYKNNQEKSFIAEINWDACRNAGQIIPVYRLYASCLTNGNPLNWLREQITKLPRGIEAIQLDLDCPESKLDKYLALVSKLRVHLPAQMELSITALPAHLNNSNFKKLAEAVNFYVLQLHGIEAPKYINDNCQLMRLPLAYQAIKRAQKLKEPFRLALPTYAYRLFFNRRTGKFSRIAAENRAAPSPDEEERLIAADIQELAELVNSIRSDPGFCGGIIWFRLPVASDKLCISRRAVGLLEQGICPSEKIKLDIVEKESGLKELYLTNDVSLRKATLEINLKWRNAKGDFDLSRGFRSSSAMIPGILPGTIIGQAPSPGHRVCIGWFRPAASEAPGTSIKEIP